MYRTAEVRAAASSPPAGPTAEEPELPDPERVDPEVLTALLVRHGWERKGGESGRYTRWISPGVPGVPGMPGALD